MNAKEAEIVNEEFILREDTYNICLGGQGGFGYINFNNLNKTEGQRKSGILAAKRNKNIFLDLYNNDTFFREYHKSNLVKSREKLSEMYPEGTFKGKTHTKEWKENHSRIMKDKQAGSKNSQFGTMWITNGIENKKIKKDVDIIPEGWYKGRMAK